MQFFTDDITYAWNTHTWMYMHYNGSCKYLVDFLKEELKQGKYFKIIACVYVNCIGKKIRCPEILNCLGPWPFVLQLHPGWLREHLDSIPRPHLHKIMLPLWYCCFYWIITSSSEEISRENNAIKTVHYSILS